MTSNHGDISGFCEVLKFSATGLMQLTGEEVVTLLVKL